jgi:hypothetical protein
LSNKQGLFAIIFQTMQKIPPLAEKSGSQPCPIPPIPEKLAEFFHFPPCKIPPFGVYW